MKKEIFNPPTTYKPTWQFSQAIRVRGAQDLLFLSGQVAFDREGNLVGKGDVVAQAEQVFRNLEATLSSAGATFRDVVKVNMYIVEPYESHKESIRDIRSRYFREPPFPTSTLVQVKGLANPDYLIEVEAIAVLDK